MSFFYVICTSLVLPCESQLAETHCLDPSLEFSDFVVLEGVGDVGTIARVSESINIILVHCSPYDVVFVEVFHKRDIILSEPAVENDCAACLQT